LIDRSIKQRLAAKRQTFRSPDYQACAGDKPPFLALNDQSTSGVGAPARLARRAGRGFVGIPTFKT
jgi:hypothetical protein